MAVACGTISITTGAVGTTFTVSGLSFQPTAIFLNWSGQVAATGGSETDHKWGCGIATGTASRRAYASQSDHAVGNAAADCMWHNDSCVTTLTVAGAVDGKADLDAILSDGFRLIVDDQFAVAVDVQWMAWNATNVQIVDHTTPAGTGNQDVATSFALNTGADDKAVIIIGGVFAAANTAAQYSTHSMGVVAGNSPVNAILCGASSDGAANMVTCCYCRTGDCLAEASDDAIVFRASVTAWDASGTGFRLNYTTAAANRRFSALVMQGGNRWEVGDAATATNTTNFTDSTTYTPTGIIVGSACKTAASTAGATNAEQEFSLGLATSSTNRSCAAVLDDDAPTTSDLGVGFYTDRVYVNYDEANASKVTISGIMDLVAFNAAPNVELVMDDADPTARFFWYLITADPAAGGGGDTNAILFGGDLFNGGRLLGARPLQ